MKSDGSYRFFSKPTLKQVDINQGEFVLNLKPK